MTIEERLVPPHLRDALRDADMELGILLHDKLSGDWLAYGIFPAGTDDHRLSSPVGHGKTPVAAAEALLGMTTAYRPSWGLMTRLWACGDAMASLALAIRR